MNAIPTIEFLFDFGSPNAYLAHRVIPSVERQTGTTFVYVPILLGGVYKATGNQSPVSAFAGIKGKLEYQALETRRFCARHHIDDFAMNPDFPINTLVLMRGAVAAQRLGIARKYIDAVFHYMWVDHRKLDDMPVLMASLRDADLPAETLANLAGDAAVKHELIDNTSRAVARGVFGSPSFFIGGELYFGKETLADMISSLRQQ